jgi:hypothetical protein
MTTQTIWPAPSEQESEPSSRQQLPGKPVGDRNSKDKSLHRAMRWHLAVTLVVATLVVLIVGVLCWRYFYDRGRPGTQAQDGETVTSVSYELFETSDEYLVARVATPGLDQADLKAVLISSPKGRLLLEIILRPQRIAEGRKFLTPDRIPEIPSTIQIPLPPNRLLRASPTYHVNAGTITVRVPYVQRIEPQHQ